MIGRRMLGPMMWWYMATSHRWRWSDGWMVATGGFHSAPPENYVTTVGSAYAVAMAERGVMVHR